MKAVADESVDGQIVAGLRAAGHEVSRIAEMDLGFEDEQVLAESRRQNALPLTADKDFGELVFRQRLHHCGVLLIRLPGVDPAVKADVVTSILEHHSKTLRREFAVLTERALRIRRRI